MSDTTWINTLEQMALPTNKMILEDGDYPGQAITKIGGVPWWPESIERPICKHGHHMTFIAQINLSDLPNNANNMKGILSFHYCNECMYDGNMAFGWFDDQNKNYDVRVFPDLSVKPDSKAIVADAEITPRTVKLIPITEIPNDADIPYEIFNTLPDDFLNYTPPDYDNYSPIASDTVWPTLKHVHSCKIAGHPTWEQYSQWPQTPQGRNMKFIAQLDLTIGQESAWADGTAYLFAHKNPNNTYQTELALQMG